MKFLRRMFFALALSLPLAATATTVTRADDIVDTAIKAGSFNTLVAAVKAADLVGTLKSKGPFTVFAPTDAAFAKLPAGTLDTLLKPENKAVLADILTYHVLPGSYPAERIVGAKERATQYGIKSAEGSMVQVDLREGVKVSGANVTQTDIMTDNGVIHVIDTVILPKSAVRALSGKPAKTH